MNFIIKSLFIAALIFSTKAFSADVGCTNWIPLDPPSSTQVLNLCQINIEGEPIILGVTQGRVDGFWSGNVYDSNNNFLGSPSYSDYMQDAYPQTVEGSNPQLAWFFAGASTYVLVWNTATNTPFTWNQACWTGSFMYQDIFVVGWQYLTGDNPYGCQTRVGFM